MGTYVDGELGMCGRVALHNTLAEFTLVISGCGSHTWEAVKLFWNSFFCCFTCVFHSSGKSFLPFLKEQILFTLVHFWCEIELILKRILDVKLNP